MLYIIINKISSVSFKSITVLPSIVFRKHKARPPFFNSQKIVNTKTLDYFSVIHYIHNTYLCPNVYDIDKKWKFFFI